MGKFYQKKKTDDTEARHEKRYKLDPNTSGISNFLIHITTSYVGRTEICKIGWHKIGSKSIIKNYIRMEESKTEHI